MPRDIAFYGDFSLRYKTYICEHNYTTHDIEIVKWYEDNGKKYCYTIASWNDSNLISCGTRLLDEIDNMDDLEAVRKLVKIGKLILHTDPAPINLD